MDKGTWDFDVFLKRWRERIRKAVAKLFDPAIVVGDKSRARKPDELDDDEERLVELNRTWRRMLREDPWRIKLMTHVRLLQWVGCIFFALFFGIGLAFPAHPILAYLIAIPCATIPYWFWVGRWHHIIELRVFENFKKRFGKFFHLK